MASPDALPTAKGYAAQFAKTNRRLVRATLH
jgi:hypothetical protein